MANMNFWIEVTERKNISPLLDEKGNILYFSDYGAAKTYAKTNVEAHGLKAEVVQITSDHTMPKKCKNADRPNAKTSFFFSDSGEWLFDIECKLFYDCPFRKDCPGMTTAQKTPIEAVKTWNDLMRVM